MEFELLCSRKLQMHACDHGPFMGLSTVISRTLANTEIATSSNGSWQVVESVNELCQASLHLLLMLTQNDVRCRYTSIHPLALVTNSLRRTSENSARCTQHFRSSILFEVANPFGMAVLKQQDTLWPETIFEGKLVRHVVGETAIKFGCEGRPALQKGRSCTETSSKIRMN